MGRKDGVRFFIPGLPESVTDEELEKHFSRYGTLLEAIVAKEKGSEVSRGFGYVTLETGTNPDALLNDAHILGGKPIRLLMTKESLVGSDVKKVHLSNCANCSADEIRDTFSQFGQVWDVHMPKDVSTGERKRFGFVTFGTEDAFQRAVDTGVVMLNGSRIEVRPAAQTKEGGGCVCGAGGGFGKDGGKGGESWGKGGSWDGMDGAWGGKGYGMDGWGGGWEPAWGGPDQSWGKGMGWEKGGAKGCSKGGGCGQQHEGKGGDGSITYFASNLPEGAAEHDLADYFSKYGTVLEVNIVKGKDQARGIAYVTMQDGSSRDTLLSDKHEFGGRDISIMLSKENLIGVDVKKVHVDNCQNISAEALRDAFARFGPVLDVHTPKDHRTGERKKFGFVTFGSDEAMRSAIDTGMITIAGEEVPIKAAARMTSTVQPKGQGDKGMGKGSWGWGESWGKGGDPWGKGGDSWGKGGNGGDSWGKGGDAWCKGGDPWCKGGDPWGKGGMSCDPWGKGGFGDSWGDPWGEGYGKGCMCGGKGFGGNDWGFGGNDGWGGKGCGGPGAWGPACGGKGDGFGASSGCWGGGPQEPAGCGGGGCCGGCGKGCCGGKDCSGKGCGAMGGCGGKGCGYGGKGCAAGPCYGAQRGNYGKGCGGGGPKMGGPRVGVGPY
mmetsp:Transcript_69822/g.176559  ORF Transcript_69822/g.176559 Transcript_69822/m.176559 type:complete len:660 (+) Transcript_69822:65-2044(+)